MVLAKLVALNLQLTMLDIDYQGQDIDPKENNEAVIKARVEV